MARVLIAVAAGLAVAAGQTVLHTPCDNGGAYDLQTGRATCGGYQVSVFDLVCGEFNNKTCVVKWTNKGVEEWYYYSGAGSGMLFSAGGLPAACPNLPTAPLALIQYKPAYTNTEGVPVPAECYPAADLAGTYATYSKPNDGNTPSSVTLHFNGTNDGTTAPTTRSGQIRITCNANAKKPFVWNTTGDSQIPGGTDSSNYYRISVSAPCYSPPPPGPTVLHTNCSNGGAYDLQTGRATCGGYNVSVRDLVCGDFNEERCMVKWTNKEDREERYYYSGAGSGMFFSAGDLPNECSNLPTAPLALIQYKPAYTKPAYTNTERVFVPAECYPAADLFGTYATYSKSKYGNTPSSVTLHFSGINDGTTAPTTRSGQIRITCNANAKKPFVWNTTGDSKIPGGTDSSNYYRVSVSAPCSPSSPPPPSPTPTSPTPTAAATTGTILLGVFFGGGAIYLVGGFAYNTVRQRKGSDRIPHLDFWSSLPGLAREGFRFTKSKVVKTEDYTPL